VIVARYVPNVNIKMSEQNGLWKSREIIGHFSDDSHSKSFEKKLPKLVGIVVRAAEEAAAELPHPRPAHRKLRIVR
jgi:hypothetical protein